MNVLAFDTCFGAVSAAVSWTDRGGQRRLQEAYEPMAVGHAERLLPLIGEVMRDAGLTYERLDRIAVTLGPGGFTGLRVGIAAARALALATGLPVAGMTSLALMAARAHSLLRQDNAPRTIAVAVDARREAIYFQAFSGSPPLPLTAPRLLTVSEAVAALPPGDHVVVGSAGALVAEIAARSDIDVQLPDLQPHAGQLAQVASFLEPLTRVAPLYLRAADAKPSAAPPLSRRPG